MRGLASALPAILYFSVTASRGTYSNAIHVYHVYTCHSGAWLQVLLPEFSCQRKGPEVGLVAGSTDVPPTIPQVQESGYAPYKL